MDSVLDHLRIMLLNISPVYQYLAACGIIMFSFFLRNSVMRGLLGVLHRMTVQQSEHFHARAIEILSKPLSFLVVVAGLYVGERLISLPFDVRKIFLSFLETLVSFTVFFTLYKGIEPLSFVFDKLHHAFGAESTSQMKNFTVNVTKTLIVVIGFLTILQGWGVNMGALLTGVGLFGVSVGLAAQDTFKHFFGSFAIFMDQNFKKGDWIRTTDVEGIVENIGIRTTTIRKFDKSTLVVPNATLTNAAIVNLSEVTNWLIAWTIHLSHDTTADQLLKIKNGVREFVVSNPHLETDPKKALTLIHADQFGDYAIDFYCHFFTKTVKWEEYMDVKENCLIAIKKIIEQAGAQIAVPYIPFDPKRNSSTKKKNKNDQNDASDNSDDYDGNTATS